MSATPDPWAVLGIPRDADLATARAAWKRIARASHPDRNPGDPEAERRFKDASAAWALLSDPDAHARLRDAATWPRAGAPDPHGALTREVARAVDEIGELLFRRVLPAYVARYDRGLGAELCWTLLRDIDALTLLELPREAGAPGFGARGQVDDLLRRLRVRLDPRARTGPDGEPLLASLTLVTDRGLQWAAITVWVGSIQEAGLHDPDLLRVRLLPALAREVVRALETTLPDDLAVLRWRDRTGKSGFPADWSHARRRDGLEVARRVAVLLGAATILALAAWAGAWAWTGRPLFW